MQKIKTLIVLSILLLSTLACNALISLPDSNSAPTQVSEPPSNSNAPLTEAEVPRVTAKDAKTAFDSGEAIIVDVRSRASYETGHVAEAFSIPLGEFETNIASVDLPKDQWIITYCTWPSEHTSARAAFIMLHNGYEKVSALLGGLDAWINAGYPIEP